MFCDMKPSSGSILKDTKYPKGRVGDVCAFVRFGNGVTQDLTLRHNLILQATV